MTNILINNSPTIFAHFISAGTFLHSPGWIHAERIIDTYELIIPIQGTINIQVNEKKYQLLPNTIFLIPPGTIHFGTFPSQEFIRFNWLHFKLTDIQTIKSTLLTQELITQVGLMLPDFSNNLSMSRIHVALSQLLDIYQANGSQSYLDNLLINILYEISMQERITIQRKMAPSAIFQPIKEWIRIHATESIKLSEIADFFGYNSSYLSRIYPQKMGITIFNEIKNYRIAEAKTLLLNSSLTIDQIASKVGYSDAKYFMRTFKKAENITPSEFRQAYHRRHLNKK